MTQKPYAPLFSIYAARDRLTWTPLADQWLLFGRPKVAAQPLGVRA